MTAEPLVMHQARWVITMEGPVIEHGAVLVAGERLAAVGPVAEIRELPRGGGLGEGAVRYYDHGEGAIIPALVNAHVHLEFGGLRGAIAPQKDLPAWLEAAMGGLSALTPEQVEQGVRDGIGEMRRFGTVLAAEVSNTGRSLPWLSASGMDFHYFYECLGFDLLNEGALSEDFPFLTQPACRTASVSAAAHAPYSVSAPLFRRIKAWNQGLGRLTSVHLAESRDEVQFLRRGNGPFQELLTRRGRRQAGFTAPGCSPAAYLDRLGFWDEPTLAVHGVWLEAADRELLARRGVRLALCPRSNRHTGAGWPDLPALRQAGVGLALGTDSLASNQDLNLFQEIKELQEHFPEVQPSDLLALATINGAAALERADDLGSLRPGKKAALLFLPVAPGAAVWPGLLAAGVQGRIFWLTPRGKEVWHGA